MLRDDLDDILIFIGSQILTTEEWESNDFVGTPTDLQKYNFLLGVLNQREVVSQIQDRLFAYFKAKGTTGITEPNYSRSNIFLGEVL